jgi:hypothetical protein
MKVVLFQSIFACCETWPAYRPRELIPGFVFACRDSLTMSMQSAHGFWATLFEDRKDLNHPNAFESPAKFLQGRCCDLRACRSLPEAFLQFRQLLRGVGSRRLPSRGDSGLVRHKFSLCLWASEIGWDHRNHIHRNPLTPDAASACVSTRAILKAEPDANHH